MDYELAASYWEKQDSQTVKIDQSVLLDDAEKFIMAHNTCALATGFGTFVRCTPIEYSYLDGKFWMLSEGGLKFRALACNSNVCLAIFDPYGGFAALGGMQVTGTAEIIEPWSENYLKLLAFKKLPAENLKKLPHVLYLIRVTPVRIDFLCSEFKKRGYASRQQLIFEPTDAVSR